MKNLNKTLFLFLSLVAGSQALHATSVYLDNKSSKEVYIFPICEGTALGGGDPFASSGVRLKQGERKYLYCTGQIKKLHFIGDATQTSHLALKGKKGEIYQFGQEINIPTAHIWELEVVDQ
jgi:hypothetical protein